MKTIFKVIEDTYEISIEKFTTDVSAADWFLKECSDACFATFKGAKNAAKVLIEERLCGIVKNLQDINLASAENIKHEIYKQPNRA